MFNGKKIIVVLPAYNAAKTLRKTYEEIPKDIVDEVLLVDDASVDETIKIVKELGLFHIAHPKNRGYGANQKTCYREALRRGADIVIMVHPDYQYTPKLIPAMVAIVGSGLFDVALGSRILGVGALKGGMPLYKYIANRFLTAFQNLFLNYKLAEYHTGYRAFSRKVLASIDIEDNSDDFIFDNQMLAQIIYRGFNIGEVTCPTKYFSEASSINFWRSVRYGLGILWISLLYRLDKWKMVKSRLFHGNSLSHEATSGLKNGGV